MSTRRAPLLRPNPLRPTTSTAKVARASDGSARRRGAGGVARLARHLSTRLRTRRSGAAAAAQRYIAHAMRHFAALNGQPLCAALLIMQCDGRRSRALHAHTHTHTFALARADPDCTRARRRAPRATITLAPVGSRATSARTANAADVCTGVRSYTNAPLAHQTTYFRMLPTSKIDRQQQQQQQPQADRYY